MKCNNITFLPIMHGASMILGNVSYASSWKTEGIFFASLRRQEFATTGYCSSKGIDSIFTAYKSLSFLYENSDADKLV